MSDEQHVPWWRTAVIYQVYIRSFADSDGNGIGDLPGVRSRLPYLCDLGVDALWITPPVEQIHGFTDEGTGKSYGFHGYWARDFTAVDAALDRVRASTTPKPSPSSQTSARTEPPRSPSVTVIAPSAWQGTIQTGARTGCPPKVAGTRSVPATFKPTRCAARFPARSLAAPRRCPVPGQ